MPRRTLHKSLALLTALLVLLVAGLAGGSLWILRQMHGQAAHTEAARQVLVQGERMVNYLAGLPAVTKPGADADDWSALSRQVHALRTLEDGLQYVSVTRDGMTVFHEQTRGLEAGTGGLQADGEPGASGAVTVSRGLLEVGGEQVPVVVFTKSRMSGGQSTAVQVAVRKEAVEREELATTRAIGSMFKLSLVTVSISFSVCAWLVVWIMRREGLRERQRRDEEHLAFAGVLANGIVHDFRNPMSAMRLDVQMLNREVAKREAGRRERVVELAERIQRTLDRMDKVFQEFLYMSKPTVEAREAIDIGACLRESVDLLRPRFEQAGVRVDLELPAVPLRVRATTSALQRALMNVLVNAEQVSKAGGAVTAWATREGGQAVIEVLDQGPGIPARDRERIFEMFFTTRPSGTGLGLFLARTAIERDGGTIRAVENPAGGACIRIHLPVDETGGDTPPAVGPPSSPMHREPSV